MIKVELFQKKYNKDGESERKSLKSEQFPKPKSYKDFISKIISTFKVKKNDISILAYTKDEDENPINNQEDLDDYKDETEEYKIIIEKDESSSSKPEPKRIEKVKEEKEDDDEEEKEEKGDKEKEKKKIKKDKDDESKESQKDDEPKNEEDGELDDIEIKIDVNLDITDKEMENIIDSQIKPITEIQKDIYNDDLQFDIEDYKKGINDKYTNIIKDFNKLYDSKINNILNNKSSILKEEINKKFSEFSSVNISNISEIKKESLGLKDDFSDMVNDVALMDKAILEMSKIFTGDEIKKPKNKQKAQNSIQNDEDDSDEDDDKIYIIFKKDPIKKEIDLNNAKYFEIPVEIENNGNRKFEKLFFERDEKESSKDINIYSNKSNVQALTNSGNQKETHYVNLTINNPQPNKEYILYLYVTKKIGGKSLSKKLKIITKVKGEVKVEYPKKKLEEEATALYSEYADKYDLSIIIKKEEAIKKFMELENKKDSINNWIKDEFAKKDNELYDSLNIKDVVDKNEAKNAFSKLKYDEEKIKLWVQCKIDEYNNNKAEGIYKELIIKFNNLKEKINKEEVIKIIKQENFDQEKIIQWIEPQIKTEPELEPNVPPPVEDAKLEDMVAEYDNEFSILSIIEEEELKNKIKEFNYDDAKVREWIENRLAE